MNECNSLMWEIKVPTRGYQNIIGGGTAQSSRHCIQHRVNPLPTNNEVNFKYRSQHIKVCDKVNKLKSLRYKRQEI